MIETIEATPLTLAKACAEWFPDYEGRVIAVADCQITRENNPILPLIMIAFAGESARTTPHSTQPPRITEKIVVEFWRKSQLYTLSNGAESPFYAYIDYRFDRDRLLHGLKNFITPDGSILTYQACVVHSDEFAYTVEIHLQSEYVWQDYIPDEEVKLVTPISICVL